MAMQLKCKEIKHILLLLVLPVYKGKFPVSSEISPLKQKLVFIIFKGSVRASKTALQSSADQ